MGGLGNTVSRNFEFNISGVSSNIASKYRGLNKYGVNISVKSYEANEYTKQSWDGEPNEMISESFSILNHYTDKNSLRPKNIEVSRYSVAMDMLDGTRIYTVLAEPSGFAQKNMNSYIRLYQNTNGKRKQIKKSEW